jgi:hypothetical protein
MPILLPSSVIRGAPVSLVELLKAKHEIPDYQRDYVWKKSTVVQLWRDLERHYFSIVSADEIKNEPEGYFLGPIVVVAPVDSERQEVIDGQQRLTTLTCLVSILYATLADLSDEQAREGYRHKLGQMIWDFVDNRFEANLRFVANKFNGFFVKTCAESRNQQQREQYWGNDPDALNFLAIKGSPATRIRDAFEVLQESIAQFIDKAENKDRKEKRIKSLIQFVTEGVVVLRIHALSHAHAYTIFESLNNRGVPLTQADLIKFELIRATKNNDSKYSELVESWTEMKDRLGGQGSISLPEFMHYSFTSRGSVCKSSELLKTIIADGVTASADAATAYASALENDAQVLQKLLNPALEQSWSERTKELLVDLKETLQIKFCYPYLMAAFHVANNDQDLFQKHVHLIVNFAFRYMKILGNDYERFGEITTKGVASLLKGEGLPAISSLFLSEAPDALFQSEFETIGIQNTKLAFFAVYYLEWWKLKGKGVKPIDRGVDEQHLEHIMPKAPGKTDWGYAWAAKEQEKNLNNPPPKAFSQYLWRLGNLLPLPAGFNLHIKNKGIAYKIKNAEGKDYSSCASDSPRMVATFLENNDWTFNSIEKRQADMAKEAVLAWTLNPNMLWT